MELRHVRAFLVLAEELHFGRAAARLHIAQPSLSQQIRRLERDVGVELVRRTSHEVGLTAAGAVFRDEAVEIVRRVERAEEAARAVAEGRRGLVRVGYNLPAGKRVLPGTLGRLAERCPGIEVEMRELRTGPQLAALQEGRLDVALVYGRPASRELRSRLLLRVPLVAVVGVGHRWARLEGVPFRELKEERCVLFRRAQSSAMYDAIMGAARDAGIELSVVEVVDDPGATAIITEVRPVVGFASALRGRAERTVPVRLYDPVPILDVCAVWRADPGPLVTAFLGCLPAAATVSGAAT
ncbi:LysR substrate-binding domain-containing protein [Actinocorallia sp. API 0066]|uniref:LysR family transcriptional regulator n=1 Tax=Actinocorallia sp. API 0066 TaxID=2896846 RepID=UPI001E62B27A|nr:LysR substrate-binding domain-containing protein [Actinocorallia sp. API 0066]MCD0453039.1 LysR substrate-binding domain-containing protein [Actinocorallia sp. API 0066]